MIRRERPFPGQAVMRAKLDGEYTNADLPVRVESLDEANIVTSQVETMGWAGERHKPVLDIDCKVQVVPSSTPGHHHLFIDHEMTWMQYKNLLGALTEAGIIEPGYYAASVNRGYTAVRLPWIKKERLAASYPGAFTGADPCAVPTF